MDRHRSAPTRRRALLTATALAVLLATIGCAGSDGDDRSSSSSPAATAPATTAAEDLEALAVEGYLLGYPLVVTTRTLQTFGAALGVNRPFTQQAISDASSRVVVAPNTDTLYAIAVLDLRSGPLLLTVPDIPDRYHTFQLLDAWTESFAYLGTRTTGGVGGTWLLAPPGWDGEVPADVERIDVPTPQAFLLGRVLVDGPDDVAAVTALTDQVELRPLDPAAPPPPPLGDAPGPPAATGSDGLAFWDELGRALAVNPPTTPAQRALVDRLGALGVGPGRTPSTEVDDPVVLAALEGAVAVGNERLSDAAADSAGDDPWPLRTDLGTYGDDLELRAVVARVGWGANVPQEAVYLRAVVDDDGERLEGATGYRIRFAPGQAPPVDAFWSLTLYGADQFLVDNPLGRFALSDRSPGLGTGDGALEVVVATEPPPGEEDRWLPAPPGRFSLMLRLYLPRQEVLDGAWVPPSIEPLP